VLVDPVAEDRVESFLDEHDLIAHTVINTHGHGDHTSGNHSFQLQDRAEVLAHVKASDRVGKVDREIEGGDVIEVGAVSLEVIHTPGHTDGSIVLKTDSGLITGDTLFLAGCGNPKFGGDTRALFETFRDKIRPLDDDLKVYPGHDYAVRNLEFVREVDPDNETANRKLNEVKGRKVDGEEPTSTLGEEKSYNPFLRYDDNAFADVLDLPEQFTHWDVFRGLRQRRNQW
jgi:hydroxyacylglutathione hydrolase